jgi:hypothetical protein
LPSDELQRRAAAAGVQPWAIEEASDFDLIEFIVARVAEVEFPRVDGSSPLPNDMSPSARAYADAHLSERRYDGIASPSVPIPEDSIPQAWRDISSSAPVSPRRGQKSPDPSSVSGEASLSPRQPPHVPSGVNPSMPAQTRKNNVPSGVDAADPSGIGDRRRAGALPSKRGGARVFRSDFSRTSADSGATPGSSRSSYTDNVAPLHAGGNSAFVSINADTGSVEDDEDEIEAANFSAEVGHLQHVMPLEVAVQQHFVVPAQSDQRPSNDAQRKRNTEFPPVLNGPGAVYKNARVRSKATIRATELVASWPSRIERVRLVVWLGAIEAEWQHSVSDAYLCLLIEQLTHGDGNLLPPYDVRPGINNGRLSRLTYDIWTRGIHCHRVSKSARRRKRSESQRQPQNHENKANGANEDLPVSINNDAAMLAEQAHKVEQLVALLQTTSTADEDDAGFPSEIARESGSDTVLPGIPCPGRNRIYYRALYPVRLRAGIDIDSSETEIVRPGEIIEVLESLKTPTAPNPENTLRLRCSLGWASLAGTDGLPLLERVLFDASSVSDSSRPGAVDIAQLSATQDILLVADEGETENVEDLDQVREDMNRRMEAAVTLAKNMASDAEQRMMTAMAAAGNSGVYESAVTLDQESASEDCSPPNQIQLVPIHTDEGTDDAIIQEIVAASAHTKNEMTEQLEAERAWAKRELLELDQKCKVASEEAHEKMGAITRLELALGEAAKDADARELATKVRAASENEIAVAALERRSEAQIEAINAKRRAEQQLVEVSTAARVKDAVAEATAVAKLQGVTLLSQHIEEERRRAAVQLVEVNDQHDTARRQALEFSAAQARREAAAAVAATEAAALSRTERLVGVEREKAAAECLEHQLASLQFEQALAEAETRIVAVRGDAALQVARAVAATKKNAQIELERSLWKAVKEARLVAEAEREVESLQSESRHAELEKQIAYIKTQADAQVSKAIAVVEIGARTELEVALRTAQQDTDLEIASAKEAVQAELEAELEFERQQSIADLAAHNDALLELEAVSEIERDLAATQAREASEKQSNDIVAKAAASEHKAVVEAEVAIAGLRTATELAIERERSMDALSQQHAAALVELANHSEALMEMEVALSRSHEAESQVDDERGRLLLEHEEANAIAQTDISNLRSSASAEAVRAFAEHTEITATEIATHVAAARLAAQNEGEARLLELQTALQTEQHAMQAQQQKVAAAETERRVKAEAEVHFVKMEAQVEAQKAKMIVETELVHVTEAAETKLEAERVRMAKQMQNQNEARSMARAELEADYEATRMEAAEAVAATNASETALEEQQRQSSMAAALARETAEREASVQIARAQVELYSERARFESLKAELIGRSNSAQPDAAKRRTSVLIENQDEEHKTAVKRMLEMERQAATEAARGEAAIAAKDATHAAATVAAVGQVANVELAQDARSELIAEREQMKLLEAQLATNTAALQQAQETEGAELDKLAAEHQLVISQLQHVDIEHGQAIAQLAVMEAEQRAAVLMAEQGAMAAETARAAEVEASAKLDEVFQQRQQAAIESAVEQALQDERRKADEDLTQVRRQTAQELEARDALHERARCHAEREWAERWAQAEARHSIALVPLKVVCYRIYRTC